MQTPRSAVVHFDHFEVDLRSGELRRDGIHVALQEKPFQILQLLMASPGETVTREELIQALWPSGTFVEFDRSLNTAVNKLRVALGDSADGSRVIETVGRRGYRFIADPGSRQKSARARRFLILIALLLLAATGAVLFQRFPRKKPAPAIHSIAVLPLTNLSKDREQEFFVDGMTDQLITTLAKVRGLDVISHQSVMQFKASKVPLPQIVRQLGVDAIVEGSVERHGNRVRITAQLVDARTDRHLWANDYEGDLGDVLSLQDNVAHDIADQIGIKLVGATAPSQHANSDAYLLYLRGLYEWNKLPPNFGPAMAFFEQAIQQDPTFARAYAGLADCYFSREGWVNTPYAPTDGAKAAELAKKALALNPALAEPHATLAALQTEAHNYAAAEGHYRRAIAANSNYIIGHQWYSLLLSRLGRFDEAVHEGRIAVQLDPLSPYAKGTLALALESSGRTSEAIECRRTLARLFPDDASQHFKLFYLLHQLKRDDEAIHELCQGLTQSGFAPLASRIEAKYPTAGVNAVEIYLNDPVISREESRWSLARMHAVLHHRDATLTNLERSYATRGAIAFLNVTPEFKFVRGDPRFRQLLKQLRLQPN